VASLVEDDDGDFWMASNRGVHRVHRSEVEDFLEGRIDAVGGRGYGGRDGFVNPETTGNASYRSEDGRLWFPTFAGVAVVDPEELDALEETPPGVRIRGAWLDETLRPADSVLHLPLGRRRIEIEYGGILLRGGERTRYEVRVEDVDPDWVDVGPVRRVTYGNLPPGRHTFRVRAVAPSGTVRSEPATATLVVPPYSWETPAFRGLMVLLGAVALVGVGQLRSRRLRARAAELSSLIDARTAELAEAKARAEMALVTVENQAETLRSLDAAKSRFFANVSHELRTPLTLLRGPLRDVLEGRHGELPKAVEEQVSIALDSGHRLTELVEQLLDVARLEAGERDLTLAIHDLGALLRRLVGSFGALAASRGITFRAEVPDGPIRAVADLDRMEKVYSNLLANALKFTPSGGTVGIEAALDGHEMVVSVQDTGPGIAPADQERIFERFQQVDDSDRRAHEGAGLGLTLVREITELHGGTVELTSTPGEGSRFTVRIPTGRPDEGAGNGTGDVGALDPSVEDLQTDLDLPDGTDRDGAENGEADPPTVLVIEDHDELRAYVRRHLEPDYRVLEASDGRQGLAAARQTVPDVILCDIMMPKTDGEAVVRAIRADPELDHLPVVMLTAKASRESRLSALEGGANDYLVKPFDPEELRLRVHNMLEGRRRLADRIREESRGLPLIAAELEAADPADRFVRRFRTVLGERLGDEEFDTEAMAGALSMSRASLYRKCGDAFDVSPAELIWRARLDRAAQLLRTTDGTVSVVAYACGFKTVPHFARRFRERFGNSPAAWRASE
ncbi:MAG: ATP-binding protein, partial [Gemmatimonadota bacterium]|jgi:signal transduction histidine kinase/DNA-binding response OmpR family regulator